MAGQLAFEDTPEVLDRVEVRRLGWSLHNLKTMVFEPGFGLLAGVLGIVVLLEDNVIGGLAPILKAILQCILQDADIEVGVHLALNLHHVSRPLPPKTAPEHQTFTAILHCALHQT